MRRRGLVSVVVGLVFVRTALVACVGDDPTPPARRGDENGECFADLTCNTGLDCLSGRCVRLPAKDATPTPVGPDTSPPDTTPDTGADTGAPPEEADAEPPAADAEAPLCDDDAGPCVLTGLIAWFRADRGVVVKDGLVQKWEDQSPKLRHASLQDADAPPTFRDASRDASDLFKGGPRLEFKGVPQAKNADRGERLVTATFSPVTATTIYVVLSKEGGRAIEYVLDGLGDRYAMAFGTGGATGSQALLLGTDDLPLDMDASADGKSLLFEAVFSGGQSAIRINDTASVVDGGLGMNPLNGLTIGSSRPAFTQQRNNFGGSVAEIIVFEGVQTGVQRQHVISWLRKRHGF